MNNLSEILKLTTTLRSTMNSDLTMCNCGKCNEDMNMNRRDASVDIIQSAEYEFPYHYIPNSKGFPYFCRQWAFSASYLAAIKIAKDWLESIGIDPPHRHMDYGCGDGGFVNALSRVMTSSDIRLEGIDYDENAIRWAKLFARNSKDFSAGDVASLDADSYDSGTLVEVFEHIPPSDCEKFVEMIAQSLKKSALLFVTVPSTEKPVSAKHYRHFDFETLGHCFSKYFEVIESFGFEKGSLIQKIITKLTMNPFIYFETKFTSEFVISQFSSKHAKLSGCGRIGMILKRK